LSKTQKHKNTFLKYKNKITFTRTKENQTVI